jgi:hypothetical protein
MGIFDNRIPAFQALERLLGARATAFVRGLLFMPAGLSVGVASFVVFLVVATNSGDEDVSSIGGLVAGAVGGFCSVIVGLAIAPRSPRLAAAVMATACVALGAGAFLWAYGTRKNELVVSTAIAGGMYGFTAVVAAVSFIRLSTKEKI